MKKLLILLLLVPLFSLITSTLISEEFNFKKTLKFAKQGSAEAQYTIGSIYLYGMGTEISKDGKKAIKWLSLSLEQGYMYSYDTLGSVYLNGEIVPRDINKAIKLWTYASENLNYSSSSHKLGLLYKNGFHGFSKDNKKALYYLNLAKEQKSGLSVLDDDIKWVEFQVETKKRFEKIKDNCISKIKNQSQPNNLDDYWDYDQKIVKIESNCWSEMTNYCESFYKKDKFLTKKCNDIKWYISKDIKGFEENYLTSIYKPLKIKQDKSYKKDLDKNSSNNNPQYINICTNEFVEKKRLDGSTYSDSVQSCRVVQKKTLEEQNQEAFGYAIGKIIDGLF